MRGTPLLRGQFQVVHKLLDAEFDSVLIRSVIPYARVTVWEDVIVNGILAGRTPLAFSTWRGRTGLSQLPPLATPAARHAWAEHVRVEPFPFRAYARAVHAATDAYLAQLDPLSGGESQIRVLVALLLKVSTLRTEVGTLFGE